MVAGYRSHFYSFFSSNTIFLKAVDTVAWRSTGGLYYTLLSHSPEDGCQGHSQLLFLQRTLQWTHVNLFTKDWECGVLEQTYTSFQIVPEGEAVPVYMATEKTKDFYRPTPSPDIGFIHPTNFY